MLDNFLKLNSYIVLSLLYVAMLLKRRAVTELRSNAFRGMHWHQYSIVTCLLISVAFITA